MRGRRGVGLGHIDARLCAARGWASGPARGVLVIVSRFPGRNVESRCPVQFSALLTEALELWFFGVRCVATLHAPKPTFRARQHGHEVITHDAVRAANYVRTRSVRSIHRLIHSVLPSFNPQFVVRSTESIALLPRADGGEKHVRVELAPPLPVLPEPPPDHLKAEEDDKRALR